VSGAGPGPSGARSDATVVKVREGLVANRPIYLAVGVTVESTRDILGVRPGTVGRGPGIGCTCTSP
jgi:hypothetical protein